MSGKTETAALAERTAGEPLVGNVKVTRDDWLSLALDVLISDGVEQVKILSLSEKLGVSRSSFYWYFESRQDLLDALLDHWETTNTGALVKQAQIETVTITQAVCNVFRCFIDVRLFNNRLDFAVREWARRSASVRAILDRSDETRLAALTAMFRRFDYDEMDAVTRARILYYMQIGYYAAELNEPLETRLAFLPTYIVGFTGVHPRRSEIDELVEYAHSVHGS
ncbi:MAG: TetR/AcrR family transcriptional regulator [Pseudomonadota bacterium]